MDESHDPISVRATTAPSEKAYSPSAPSRIKNGVKAKMVVSEEIKSGVANCLPDAIAASLRAVPASTCRRISSTITTPLSTNRPSEMITAAMETCSSAISRIPIPRSENITANGTIDAITRPERQPRNARTTNTTTMKVCPTFESASATAVETASGWKVAKSSEYPIGSAPSNAAVAAFTRTPTA